MKENTMKSQKDQIRGKFICFYFVGRIRNVRHTLEGKDLRMHTYIKKNRSQIKSRKNLYKWHTVSVKLKYTEMCFEMK